MNQFEDMLAFVRIVEAGSITRAAEQMDTVKSAVSRRLTELEKRLGVELLTRTTRAQSLTDSGRSYYQQCLRLIDDVSEMESSVSSEHSALKGRIKITAPLSFGLAHLGTAFLKFNELHPDILLDVDFNDRKIDLVEEDYDLAIRISVLEDSSLVARRLTSTRLILCASPAYIEKYGMPEKPQDLTNGHHCILYKDQLASWTFLDENGEKLTIRIPSALNANNAEFLSQAAMKGVGLMYTPDFICYQRIKEGDLLPLLNDFLTDNIIDAYALYPQTKYLSKRVRSLMDYLVNYFSGEPYWRIN
jgi:DNA-binding transcriptional LysR family regulator